MNKVILIVLEWLAYAVAAIALGSLLRISFVDKSSTDSGRHTRPMAVAAQGCAEDMGRKRQLSNNAGNSRHDLPTDAARCGV